MKLLYFRRYLWPSPPPVLNPSLVGCALYLAENSKPPIPFGARVTKSYPLPSQSAPSLVLGGIMKPSSSSSRKIPKNGPGDVPHVFQGGPRVNQTALGVHYGRQATPRQRQAGSLGVRPREEIRGEKRVQIFTKRLVRGCENFHPAIA